ncbi:DUF4145 domain-containing protein [Microbacterium oxydans]|jgi:hypothetical protein|uniref:DUF4145 domain-containing protein n=1 Tax=Microbacterium oxydans TaxID=82380 RepID=UPI0037CC2546
MLSGICAFCGNQTHFTARSIRIGAEVQAPEPKTYYHTYEMEVAGTCDACKRFNSGFGLSGHLQRSLTPDSYLAGHEGIAEAEKMVVAKWSPPFMGTVDTAFVPEGVAGFFKEAHDSFSIGAYRAVLLLVRSVIEATAKDHDVVTGSLVQKVNKLNDEGLIRRGTKDMAHTLRILGNDMAHGDIDEVPTQEDAKDALTIARFVLDDVYVADARRADMMKRRNKEPKATE